MDGMDLQDLPWRFLLLFSRPREFLQHCYFTQILYFSGGEENPIAADGGEVHAFYMYPNQYTCIRTIGTSKGHSCQLPSLMTWWEK